MTTKRKPRPVMVRVTAETRAMLEQVKERDGVSFTAQLERAMRLWVTARRGGRHAAA